MGQIKVEHCPSQHAEKLRRYVGGVWLKKCRDQYFAGIRDFFFFFWQIIFATRVL